MAKVHFPLAKIAKSNLERLQKIVDKRKEAMLVEHKEKVLFEGCALCQINLFITVKAKSGKKAEMKIDTFFDDNSDKLNFSKVIKGINVDFSFDECFEVIDIVEKK